MVPMPSSCGYCAGTASARMYYLLAIRLELSKYCKLLDHGWRRSGHTVYLPDNTITCCPMHSIRLPVCDFSMTKSQRYKWRKWLRTIEISDIVPSTNLFEQINDTTFIWHISFRFSIRMNTRPVVDDDSYALFLKYQEHIHHDPPSRWTRRAYKRFLIESPLVPTQNDHSYLSGGTFHQQYYDQGQLIAVSVLDLLPGHCLSSVYFFYDPSYSSWSLGCISALLEIWQCKHIFNVPFYYLGYYIHNCPKMRYKAEYRPSWILRRISPSVRTWVALDSCTTILDNDPHLFDAPFPPQSDDPLSDRIGTDLISECHWLKQ